MPYAMIAPKPGGPDVLEKHSIQLSAPTATEVQIQQTAIGVNFIDAYFREGSYPWPVESDLILGTEAAGVICEVGSDVNDFKVGDRVAYAIPNGAYASHRNLDVAHLVSIPDAIDDKTAAAIMVKGLTAHYLLHRSYKVSAGERVLFHAAAGGVGLIAGQWLAHKNVTAFGTAGGAQKCDLAAQNGFQHTIDYLSQDFVSELDRLTEGQGVDVVYDSVGQSTYPGSLKCLKTFGTFVSFGQSSGPATEFKLADLASNGSLTATRPSLFHFIAQRSYLDQAAAELFALVADGTLRIAVNQEFALDAAAEAHRQLEGRNTTGCTILVP
ncbi:MAG: quinone oxidoreductase family protein [Arenicella sp.]